MEIDCELGDGIQSVIHSFDETHGSWLVVATVLMRLVLACGSHSLDETCGWLVVVTVLIRLVVGLW